jgi:hypothetical protein
MQLPKGCLLPRLPFNSALPALTPPSRKLPPAAPEPSMSFLVQLIVAKWFLFTAVLALYAANKYRKYARLPAFKGPFSSGWSELWHTRAMLGMRSHLAYKDVNDKYGEFYDAVI